MGQTTNTIMMVRPKHFRFNPETADSNSYQNEGDYTPEQSQQFAIDEFDSFKKTLEAKGILVIVMDDTNDPINPDAIFPNNWVSFHSDGRVIIYPMYRKNRRTEKRIEIIDDLKMAFKVETVVDLSHYEIEKKFLEGTGSIVFDHVNKIAYACISPRTNQDLFIKVSDYLGYKPIYFHATDNQKKYNEKGEVTKNKRGEEIYFSKETYHTNVMMCIGVKFAVICLKSIKEEQERNLVEKLLQVTGHEIIDISINQMNCFVCNMLPLKSKDGNDILILSQTAFNNLNGAQKVTLSKYCELVPVSIPKIEEIGGGSARCMIAEVFLKPIRQ